MSDAGPPTVEFGAMPWRFETTSYGSLRLLDAAGNRLADVQPLDADEGQNQALAAFVLHALNHHLPLLRALVRCQEAIKQLAGAVKKDYLLSPALAAAAAEIAACKGGQV
jgi:hypothetical protein